MTESQNPDAIRLAKVLNKNAVTDENNNICMIEGCSAIGTNIIAVTDPEDNIHECFICDRHYEELMTRYYERSKADYTLKLSK